MEFVKNHPVISVGALLAGVAMIVLLRSGGNQTISESSVDPATVAAGTALQQTQMQIQGGLAASSMQLQAHSADIAGQIELEKIRALTTEHITEFQGNIQLAGINAQSQLGALVSTLNAQSHQAEIAATVNLRQIAATESTTNTGTFANVLVQQSHDQSAIIVANINAQSSIARGAQDVARAQIDAQCSGFFDCLF